MSWPPQSPDINQIEMVWDESDCIVKESSQQVLIHMCEITTAGKAFQVTLVERMPRVCKAIIKEKAGYLKNLNYKIYLDLFNTFLVTT
jgi:hypothetical protein